MLTHNYLEDKTTGNAMLPPPAYSAKYPTILKYENDKKLKRQNTTVGSDIDRTMVTLLVLGLR